MADKTFRPQLPFPLTYAVKQPLGTNNLSSHVDMSNVLMGDSNKFQILICKRQS
jgi:hypothetical protein